jgi:hypothetical protein
VVTDVPVPPSAVDVRDRSGLMGPTDAFSFRVPELCPSLTIIDFYDNWALEQGWSRIEKSVDDDVSEDWEHEENARTGAAVKRYRAVWLNRDGSRKLVVLLTCSASNSAETKDIQDVLVMTMKPHKGAVH